MPDCPNTRTVKTGTTDPVIGFSFRSNAGSVLNGISLAKAVAEAQANAWLDGKEGTCPDACQKQRFVVNRARALQPAQRGWVFFGWGGWIIPLPLILYGWSVPVVASWEGHFVCKEHDALEENIQVINE